ncbi:Nn.00g108580.m01.CDS01 [Neocucurbitaria sp. VM-36]
MHLFPNYFNPYTSYRDVSPPRNPHEMPRAGYYPADYRSVSPLADARGYSLEPRRPSAPVIHVNMNDGPGCWEPMGEWYSWEEAMPRGRRSAYGNPEWSPQSDLYWHLMFEDGRFR